MSEHRDRRQVRKPYDLIIMVREGEIDWTKEANTFGAKWPPNAEIPRDDVARFICERYDIAFPDPGTRNYRDLTSRGGVLERWRTRINKVAFDADGLDQGIAPYQIVAKKRMTYFLTIPEAEKALNRPRKVAVNAKNNYRSLTDRIEALAAAGRIGRTELLELFKRAYKLELQMEQTMSIYESEQGKLSALIESMITESTDKISTAVARVLLDKPKSRK